MKIRLAMMLAALPFALSGCAAVGAALTTPSATAALAAAAEYVPMALAAGVVGAIGISGVAGVEREAPGADTFDGFLRSSQDEVQLQIRNAMQGQREIAVVAGLQLQGAITRARQGYKSSLSRKVADIGEPERTFVKELRNLLADLESPSSAMVKAAGDRAQGLAIQLRVAEGTPRLGSHGPIFLYSSLPFQPVTVRGRFPTAYPEAAIPRMSVAGKSHNAYEFRPDSLLFSVLTADLNAEEPQQIVWRNAEVTVPWQSPGAEAFAYTQFEKFSVELGVLPYSFGWAEIDRSSVKVSREEKERVSEDFVAEAKAGVEPEPRCLSLSAEELAEGWTIDAGRSTVVLSTGADAPQRNERPKFFMRSQTGRMVCWAPDGLADSAGGRSLPAPNAGEPIVWRIRASVKREVSRNNVASERFDLSWGGKYSFAYAPGTWKLRYWKFGREAVEVDSTDLSSPLIKVQADAGKVVISIHPH